MSRLIKDIVFYTKANTELHHFFFESLLEISGGVTTSINGGDADTIMKFKKIFYILI